MSVLARKTGASYEACHGTLRIVESNSRTHLGDRSSREKKPLRQSQVVGDQANKVREYCRNLCGIPGFLQSDHDY